MYLYPFLIVLWGGGATRFFAFAIGKGDSDEVNRWFNSALFIHLVMPVIITAVSWPIIEYCIRHVLTIPPERIQACIWVFRFSLISTFLSMVSAPYIGMFVAKQLLTEIVFWGLIQATLAFLMAFFLVRVPGDRLVGYSAGMVVITSAVLLIQIGRASVIFKECKLNRLYWFDSARIKALFSFASWNMIGSLGTMLRSQGVALILNLLHGPKINAAFSVANQVSTQAYTFSQAMSLAMSPELNAIAGRGHYHKLHDLSLQASKFGVLFSLFFSIPLWLEMENVLQLWLRSPPDYATVFTRITIFTFLVDKATMGNMIAVKANGKIAAYQATVGGVMLLTLPLGYWMLKLFHTPVAALYAILLTSIGCSLGRVLWGKALLGHSPAVWVVRVLLPCLLVGGLGMLLACLPSVFMRPSLQRLLLVTLVSISSVVVLGWSIGLRQHERDYLIRAAETVVAKITPILPNVMRPGVITLISWIVHALKRIS